MFNILYRMITIHYTVKGNKYIIRTSKENLEIDIRHVHKGV